MKFNITYEIAGKISIILSLILILTKIAAIIISVSKADTKVNNKGKYNPINNPKPAINCNDAINFLNFLYPTSHIQKSFYQNKMNLLHRR